jgi:hypothetical protein
VSRYLEIARAAMCETAAAITEPGVVNSPRGYEKNEKGESSLPSSPAALESERNRWPEGARAPLPLHRCGALVCRSCRVHGPSPHRDGCAISRFDPCRSRWFWLSPHGAIKCIACTAPDDLGLVEAWVLARETGEGDEGFDIPREILSLLAVHGSA